MVLAESAGYSERPPQYVSVPVAVSERIFDGAIVAIDNSGGANDGRLINWDGNLVTAVNQFFLGIARVTDATGVAPQDGEAKVGDTAGSVLVDVDISGVVLRNVQVVGATLATDLGVLVFANDENSFVTQATPGLDPIGWLVRFVTANFGDVKLFSADDYRAHRGI